MDMTDMRRPPQRHLARGDGGVTSLLCYQYSDHPQVGEAEDPSPWPRPRRGEGPRANGVGDGRELCSVVKVLGVLVIIRGRAGSGGGWPEQPSMAEIYFLW